MHWCKWSIVSCALVNTLFHWLSIIVHQSKSPLIGCCDSVHWSWTTRSEWRVMASLLSKEPVCRKEDCLLIDIGTVYRVIPSFTDAEKFWFIESVWKPDLLFEFPASKETSGKQRKIRQNITEDKQTRMFFVMADEAADVSNKENLLLSSSSSRGVFWLPPLLRRNNR